MLFLEILHSPQNQFWIFVAFWLINYALKYRDAAYIIYSGIVSILMWMMVGGLIGISSHVAWSYYFFLVPALVGGYLLYLSSCWISDKLGHGYNGEGAIAVIAPMFSLSFILVPSLTIKLVVYLFMGGSG